MCYHVNLETLLGAKVGGIIVVQLKNVSPVSLENIKHTSRAHVIFMGETSGYIAQHRVMVVMQVRLPMVRPDKLRVHAQIHD